MTRINWSDSSLTTAATIIFEINPNQHTSVESVESYIINTTANYVNERIANDDEPNFIGTGGWYVTLGKTCEPGYDYWAEVTIMPYTVKRYLENVKNKVANLFKPVTN